MACCLTPAGMAVLKKTDKCRGCREEGALARCRQNGNWCIHCGKQQGGCFKIGNLTFTRTSNPTPGYIPEGDEKCSQRVEETTAPVFTTALSTRARWGTNPVSMADDWTEKLQSMYTMEYHSALK
jgi:hypothetical protein